MSGEERFNSSKQRLMNTPRVYSMVPMAPSATMTRLANWSRNSWARVRVDVVMRNGSHSRAKTRGMRMFHFNAAVNQLLTRPGEPAHEPAPAHRGRYLRARRTRRDGDLHRR